MGPPSKTRRRTKVLALGVSYASIQRQMKKHGKGSILLSSSQNDTADLASVETAVECVERGILTEMDGRDLSRCLATEKHCHADVYTVSQEKGALYEPTKHLEANFNRHSFCRELKKHFQETQFDQVTLDYFWIPAGWNVQHWSRSFFEHTLVSLVKEKLLYVPTVPRKRTDPATPGVVYLPFCFHCFKEIVACREQLTKYYQISFLRQKDLKEVALWQGTQTIEPQIMQGVFGKRFDQEELYCTFGPRDVAQAMDDPSVQKETIISLARRLENFSDIRMIMLEPVIETTKSEYFTRSRIRSDSKNATKDLFYRFAGLSKPSIVKRGFDQTGFGTYPAVVTPTRPVASNVAIKSKRSPRRSIQKAVVTKVKKRATPYKRKLYFKAVSPSPRKVAGSAKPVLHSTSSRYSLRSRANVRSQSPRSVVTNIEVVQAPTAKPTVLFNEPAKLKKDSAFIN